MIERPYAIVLDGLLQMGLELVIEQGQVQEIRPHTGLPEQYVISAAFVNSHSHLEYRGLEGKLQATEYFPWIREITEAKLGQSPDDVKRDCELAARENRETGVARIGEHSDRPFSGEALANNGIDGILFQELITFFERSAPLEKVEQVKAKLQTRSGDFGGETFIALHTAYTVDELTLKSFAKGDPFSIHVAESRYENELFATGSGPIAEFYRTNGLEPHVTGRSVVQTLAEWGLVRPGAQFVHCCSVSSEDIALMATSGVTVAHCPRSNVRLKCEPAPVREMLDAGIEVGLGMDSPASSGPIDMFAEMRSALVVSTDRGKPLRGEEIWRMSTSMGNESLPFTNPQAKWDIYVGSRTPLIKIHIEGVLTVDDLIERGRPEVVEWLNLTVT